MKVDLLEFLAGFADSLHYLIGVCIFIGSLYMIFDGMPV